MDTNNNPWVESGAMVYVAITVATMSAVIMCCTWFITHNSAIQRWWHGKAQYDGVDEEEIELIDEPQKEGESRKETGYTDDEVDEATDKLAPDNVGDVFTLEDSDSDSEAVNGQIEAV